MMSVQKRCTHPAEAAETFVDDRLYVRKRSYAAAFCACVRFQLQGMS